MTRGVENYGARFRAEAKGIFLDVRTLAGVQKELKRRKYKKVPDLKTLTRWRDQEEWMRELRERDAAINIELDPDASDIEKIYQRARASRETLEEDMKKLRKKGMKAQELTQLQHAFNRALYTEAQILKVKLEAERMEKQATPTEVIFAALMDHPRFGPLLRNKVARSELEQLIAEKQLETLKQGI